MEEYYKVSCPTGYTKSFDLDTDQIICTNQSGEIVAPIIPIEQSGMGIIGWSAVISAGILVTAGLIQLYRG